MPAESKLPAFVPHKTIPACFAYHMAATTCIQCICVLYFRCRLYPNIVNNTIIAHLRSNILSCHNVVRQARWIRGSAAASDGIFPSLLLNVNQKHIYYTYTRVDIEEDKCFWFTQILSRLQQTLHTVGHSLADVISSIFNCVRAFLLLSYGALLLCNWIAQLIRQLYNHISSA